MIPDQMTHYRVGFIINPIAGMGGSVGLKGTDGNLITEARRRGAVSIAPGRAALALSSLQSLDAVTIVTCSAEMGAAVAAAGGFETEIVYDAGNGVTTAEDTRAAATAILQRNIDILLFAGGDGTAREILRVAGHQMPVLGVPSGVKMHSAVFAATARTAGDVARTFLLSADRSALLHDAEVVDRELVGEDQHAGAPKLYGVLRTPQVAFLVPGAKCSAASSDASLLEGAIKRVAAMLADDRVSLIGPGTTMQRLKQELGFDGTPLGVDVSFGGECIATDVGEERILEIIGDRPARIVVTVIGGQGFVFGRGNQQISARVIRRVGLANIVVVSSLEKLATLSTRGLLMDTGDESLDSEFVGYIPVIVGRRRTVMYPVRHAEASGQK
jgi:predicted polyphosphate/ATP-dependent NAD kinase